MKKLMLSLTTALAVIGLAACGPKAPADETAPVINGVKDLTCTVNETVNLLSGVSAVDETDGDITEKINVTLMPTLTVNDGKVTPGATGDYEVQYEVSDAAGNVQNAYATLNVTPALAEKVVYKSYSFANPETNGWGVYYNTAEGIEGTHGIVKGNYQLNVTKTNGTDWHIKFENNLATTPGVDYKIIYEFNSSVAGKIRANGNEHDINVGSNTVSYSFTADGDNKYLEVQFGLLTGPFVIDVAKVEVQKSVGEDVYTDVTPNFAYNAEGIAYSAFDNNSTGTLETTENEATLNITRGSDENGCWQTKLFVKPGFDLAAGKKYKISVDVYSLNGHDFEICYNNGDAEKGIGALYGLNLAAGETKTFEITVKHDSAKDNLVLLFQLGTMKTPQGSDVVKVSNLKIEEIGGDKQVESEATVFTPAGFGTYNDAASAEGYLYTADGKLVYEMTKIGLTDWHNKMFIEKILLESDKIYTISFKAKADKEISCALFLNVFGAWDPRLSETVNFTTTEQLYEFSLTSAFAADMNFEVLWQFGSEANNALGGATIEISEIIIYAQDVQ